MGSEIEGVRRLLWEAGFDVLRKNKHEFWGHPDGRRYSLPVGRHFNGGRAFANTMAQLAKMGVSKAAPTRASRKERNGVDQTREREVKNETHQAIDQELELAARKFSEEADRRTAEAPSPEPEPRVRSKTPGNEEEALRLAIALEKRGMSKSSASTILGHSSNSTVCNWTNAKAPIPREALRRLELLLDLPRGWIEGGEGDPDWGRGRFPSAPPPEEGAILAAPGPGDWLEVYTRGRLFKFREPALKLLVTLLTDDAPDMSLVRYVLGTAEEGGK